MKEMRNWLKENLTEVWVEEVWLPSSSDCKPFDYFVCGVSELWVKAKSCNKSKDLIQKMKEVMGSLARDTLAKACTSFRSRIEALFTADGSFIEYVDCQCAAKAIFYCPTMNSHRPRSQNTSKEQALIPEKESRRI